MYGNMDPLAGLIPHSQSTVLANPAALATRSVHAMTTMDMRKYNDPLGIIMEFEAEVLREVRPRNGESWTFGQLWKSEDWSTCKTVGRFAYLTVKMLQDMHEGSVSSVHASLVLQWKACRQYQLDNNSWANSWPLTGEADPFQPLSWAGSPQELATIAGYQKTLADLRSLSHSARGNLNAANTSSTTTNNSSPGLQQATSPKDGEKAARLTKKERREAAKTRKEKEKEKEAEK